MIRKTGGAWIGVDVGTTGVRAVAYRADGNVLAAAAAEYPLHVPRAGWAEQEPEEVAAKTERVIAAATAELNRKTIVPAGIAFSTVMHSFMALDGNRRPLTPLILWADGRGAAFAERLKAERDLSERFYQRSCCPIHSSYPLAKLLWLKEQEPALFQKMRFVGSIKDWLFERFTGDWALDHSVAGGSGLYHAQRMTWDTEILAYAGVTEAAMPPVVSTRYCRSLRRASAAALGLPDGLPVLIGASDGVLAHLGVGAVKPGQFSATIGTSGAVRVLADRPVADEKRRTWCYCLTEEAWVAGGAINNGGIALKWARDTIGGDEAEQMRRLQEDAYDLMTLQAARIAPGADGLILLPFFSGERAPYWNASVRASFVGLSLLHTRAHLIRAVLEGVCYSMNSVFCALKDATGAAQEIRVSGSFAKSPLWLQILADIFNETLHVPAVQEGAAFGAAALGFLSTGEIRHITEIADRIGISAVYRPDAENAAVYRSLYAIYEDLYRALEPQLRRIADYQERHI